MFSSENELCERSNRFSCRFVLIAFRNPPKYCSPFSFGQFVMWNSSKNGMYCQIPEKVFKAASVMLRLSSHSTLVNELCLSARPKLTNPSSVNLQFLTTNV